MADSISHQALTKLHHHRVSKADSVRRFVFKTAAILTQKYFAWHNASKALWTVVVPCSPLDVTVPVCLSVFNGRIAHNGT